MDKLSLYELLSFVVPGFLLIKLIEFYYINVFEGNSFINSDNISENLFLLCISLVLGIIIHVFTNLVILKIKFLSNIIFIPISNIRLSDYSKKVIPFLNKDYKLTKGHKATIHKKDKPSSYLFDFAYYYLEVNGKIAQAKNFQSLYFMFRNFFTINIINILISTLFIIYFIYKNDNSNQLKYTIFLLGGLIVTLPIIIYVARWLRVKMVERVFESYYAERIHNHSK